MRSSSLSLIRRLSTSRRRPAPYIPSIEYIAKVEELKDILSCEKVCSDKTRKSQEIIHQIIHSNDLHEKMAGEEATLLVMVANHIADFPLASATVLKLEQGNIEPSPVTLQLAAIAARECHDAEMALHILEKMHDSDLMPTADIQIYENCIQACISANRWMDAFALLKQLVHYTKRPSVCLFHNLTCLCIDKTEWTAFSQILDSYVPKYMTERARAQLYLVLIEKLTTLNHQAQVLELYKFIKDDLPLDTLLSIINMLARTSTWALATSMLKYHLQLQAEPTVHPTTGVTKDAFELLNMLENMPNVTISGDVYKSLLLLCGRLGLSEELQDIRARMDPEMIDYVYYTAAITVCTKHQMNRANILFQEYTQTLAESQWELSVVRAYLTACARNLEFSRIKHVIQQLRQHKVVLDTPCLSKLITAHVRLMEYEEALTLFTEFKKNGQEINRTAYADVMRAYTALDQPMNAVKLFDYIDRNGWALNLPIYQSAIRAYRRLNDREMVLALYTRLREVDGIYPSDWLLITMIREFPSKRFEFFQHYQQMMQKLDKPYGLHVCKAMLRIGSRKADVDALEFDEWLDEMLPEIQYDESMILLIISSFCKLKNAEKTVKYFKMLTHPPPNDLVHVVLNVVLHTPYEDEGYPEVVTDLIELYQNQMDTEMWHTIEKIAQKYPETRIFG